MSNVNAVLCHCGVQVMLSLNLLQMGGDADNNDLPALLATSQPAFSNPQVCGLGWAALPAICGIWVDVWQAPMSAQHLRILW